MRSLRLAVAIACAVAAHTATVALSPELARALDWFLLATVFFALGAGPVAGAFGGMFAGFVADALAGGPYGLTAFADTIAGYGSAYLAQRLVVRRPTRVLLLFALVSAAQQAILLGLALLLLPEPGLPAGVWVLGRVASTGILGMLLVAIRDTFSGRIQHWSRRRKSKLR